MKNRQQKSSSKLSIPVDRNSKLFHAFIERIHRDQLQESSFLSIDQIVDAAGYAEERLERLNLPAASRSGAAYTHIERGGNPDQLIRPIATLKLERTSVWRLVGIKFSHMFAMESPFQGLQLKRSQKEILILADLTKPLSTLQANN